MGWTLKLIIASSVIALDTTGARFILGTVVFSKATSDESKGRSRGLIYVGHTGGCISKVESCTDATTAASIFPPSPPRIYILHTHTYIYIYIICVYGQHRQRYTTTSYCVDADATSTTPIITWPSILKLLYNTYIYIYICTKNCVSVL